MRFYKIPTIMWAMIPLMLQGQHARFYNEATDTIRINQILGESSGISDPNERVASIASRFVGVAYRSGTLESVDGQEALTVNLEEVDCTTLVDQIMALAITAGEGRRSWRDFIYNLRSIRYLDGDVNGYPSRLHYVSEWVVDNVHRGNFLEVTQQCPLADYEVKTIDFMTQNRHLYPALSDDAAFERIKSMEIGYRNHRYPLIKSKNVGKAAKGFLKDGDIVALTTAKSGLDVSHMGIIKMVNGAPHLLHASQKGGKVITDKSDLQEYLRKNRQLTGIRVFRLKE